MSKKKIVEFKKVSNTEDAIIINTVVERCRKCNEKLFGGEIEYKICDSCNE